MSELTVSQSLKSLLDLKTPNISRVSLYDAVISYVNRNNLYDEESLTILPNEDLSKVISKTGEPIIYTNILSLLSNHITEPNDFEMVTGTHDLVNIQTAINYILSKLFDKKDEKVYSSEQGENDYVTYNMHKKNKHKLNNRIDENCANIDDIFVELIDTDKRIDDTNDDIDFIFREIETSTDKVYKNMYAIEDDLSHEIDKINENLRDDYGRYNRAKTYTNNRLKNIEHHLKYIKSEMMDYSGRMNTMERDIDRCNTTALNMQMDIDHFVLSNVASNNSLEKPVLRRSRALSIPNRTHSDEYMQIFDELVTSINEYVRAELTFFDQYDYANPVKFSFIYDGGDRTYFNRTPLGNEGGLEAWHSLRITFTPFVSLLNGICPQVAEYEYLHDSFALITHNEDDVYPDGNGYRFKDLAQYTATEPFMHEIHLLRMVMYVLTLRDYAISEYLQKHCSDCAKS